MSFYRRLAGSALVVVAISQACSVDRVSDRDRQVGDNHAGHAGTADAGTGGSATGGTGEGGMGNIIQPPDASADACAAQSADVTPQPPILQMVVDISGSMLWDVTNEEPDAGEATKWDLTKAALTEAINAMPENLGLGMSFFPNVGDLGFPCIVNEATVPIAWLTPAQRAAAEAAANAKMPAGSTPTHDAWAFGYETVKATPLRGKRFTVVITDGAPTVGRNCIFLPDNQALSRDVAQALATDGVGTFVLGSPGSQGGGSGQNMQPDGRPDLSRMAEAGGTAPLDPVTGALACSHTGPKYCHFDMTQSTDLTQALIDALAKVTTDVIDSVIDVPPAPPGQKINTESIEVIYIPNGSDPNTGDAGSMIVPRSGPPCSDGWYFTDDTRTKVELCGSWKTLVQADPKARLIVRYDCIVITT